VAATNLTDICAEAGLSMGALYKHFSSREDLLEAILQLRLQHRNELAAAYLDSSPSAATAFCAECGEL
jgi:AcrR family transcriptional regulator